MLIRSLSRALLAIAAALAVACSSAPKPPPPTVVAATVSTAADVNPDTARRASPLVLRFYELSSRATFEAADFVSLFERDKQVLAGEMLSREEWIMAPGEKRPWNKNLAPDTRFIGVTAAYREIERANWRLVVPVKQQATNAITIRADKLVVSATGAAH